MLDHRADCTILDNWKYNAMHWFAVFGSDVEVFKALLEHHGDINIIDGLGETPLHRLASRPDLHLELLRAFLEKGAGVNIDDKASQSKVHSDPQLH